MGVTTSVFDPMLVRWCAAVDEGGYNEWIPAESNTANSQRLGDGSEIRGAVYSRNQILIWTDNSLHGMTPTGGDYIFTTVQIGTNCGLVGLHAAVEADGVAFWMSQKNFFMYDGTLRILPCSVRQYIFDDLNENEVRDITIEFFVYLMMFDNMEWFIENPEFLPDKHLIGIS